MAKSARGFELTYRWNLAVGAVFLAITLLGYGLQLQISEFLPTFFSEVVLTSLVLGVTFVSIFVIGSVLTLLRETTGISAHKHEVGYRFGQLIAVIVGLLVITVSIWEFTVGDVLIGAGVITVLLAVAARKTLESVLSGIIIITTDILRVGDWVKIGDRFGRIEHISLFNTQVLSPQGETHIFPNDEITSRDITNLAYNRYRNDVLVGIDYETDIRHALTLCDTVLSELTEIQQNQVDGFNPTSVKSLDDSQITLAVKMWVRQPTPQAINRAQTTVLTELRERFGEENITIPFPQRTVGERSSNSSAKSENQSELGSGPTHA